MNSKKFIKAIALCVMVMASVVAVHAQTRVSGTVIDESAQPVVGATVLVVGTTNGVMTDNYGKWSLTVSNSETDQLEISCLGYVTITEKVRGRSVIDATMKESTEVLDDVVVVGYGTQKKVNLTGSVATISASDLGENRTIVSPTAALAGLVPGMTILQTTSKPGNESTTLRIRGVGSFTSGATSPYVLIDGIEGDLEAVNTADIESISVLKDAASTAIYGTRAANGVILVTTKQGTEKKPVISYSYNGVFQTPYAKYDYISDYADYMTIVNECFENMGSAHPFPESDIAAWRAAKEDPNGISVYGTPNYMAYPNTDWFNEIFKTGYSQEHKLSISGGSSNVRYLISGSYLDNQGIMQKYEGINSSSQKAFFRTNVEADVTKWFTVGTQLSGRFTAIGPSSVSVAFNNVSNPGIYIGEPGKWGRLQSPYDNQDSNNVFYRMAGTGGYNHYWDINATVYAKIRPYKGITIEGKMNYTTRFNLQHTYTQYNALWDYQTDSLYSETKLEDATVTDYTGRRYYFTTEVLARYDATFKKDHVLNVLLGYSTETYRTWAYSVTMKGATDWSMNDASTYSSLNSSSYTAPNGWALRSYFARVNYAFKDRYLFEANLRVDGSSKFGSANRFGVFPSFSAGWKMHEEPWMAKASNWLSELKVRASWGETGNDTGIGNYDWQATYTTGNVEMDNSDQKGVYMSSANNFNLKWETTSTLDVGIDASFFNNRLSIGLDYYYKNTRDILYTPSTYVTMGSLSAVPQNLGSMWNQGVEIALNWKDTINGQFYYYAGVNFSYNKNMVTKFKGVVVDGYDDDGNYYTNYSDVKETYGDGVLIEGHPIGELYIRKLYRGTGEGYTGGVVDINAGPKDGMIRTEADMAWVKAMIDAGYTFMGGKTIDKTALWYGDFVYADLNGDGDYGNSYDRYFTGHSSLPNATMGITLGFSWKGIDLSMVWSAALDYYLVWSTVYYNTSNSYFGTYISKRIANDHYFYDPENPTDERTNINGTYPRLDNYYDPNDEPSDFYNYRSDYLKLKNLTIGYTIPQKWTRQFFVKQLKVYVSGDNLLTITKYPGWDPEIGTSITYPLMRQYTIGAQITF